MSYRLNLLYLMAICLIVLLLTGCATRIGGPNSGAGQERIDNVPMYGQPEIERPEFWKRADDDFIKNAVGLFKGDREKASKAWAQEANNYFMKGDLDYAMRRYNQSWLLNENNYQPYWGFGQVMIMRGNSDEAIKYYERAKTLINDDYQKPALLTDLGIAYSRKAKDITNDQELRSKYFALANNYFRQSSEMDNTYATVWEVWANSLYHEGRYKECWEKVKKADSMGTRINPKFREKLNQTMPEPK